jgi:elongation factor P--beta-lysine ligase
MKNFQSYFIKEYTVQGIREYFISNGFHEVETPTLLTQVPLEPNLYTMKTRWQERNIDFYLATSPESSLKKLIAQGIGNCFAISKVFRDLEDIGPTHNLEFSMLEWYEMDRDYKHIAKTTEDLVLRAYHQILKKQSKPKTNILFYQGKEIDLTPPWHRFTLRELFQKHAKMDLSENLDTESIIATAKAKGYDTASITTWEPLYTQIFINEIESKLPQDKPVFIFDYPTQLSPLCKLCEEAGFSQRYEFYIGGMEIGNAYTELTDAKILEENFRKEKEFRKKNNLPLHPYDQELVEATKNFPQCTGIGLGIDRLAMLFANTTNIEDVLYFPTSRLLSVA